MVTLNRIYTRSGDGGTTRLATGETVSKTDLRVEAYGAVDETNACLGLARVHTAEAGEFRRPSWRASRTSSSTWRGTWRNPPRPARRKARLCGSWTARWRGLRARSTP